MTATPACHLCGGTIREIEGFRDLPRAASDCRPWPAGGRLGVCETCGGVVKPRDEAFLREADAIYAGYDLYHQSEGGAEQSVFDQATGAATPRSQRILSFTNGRAALGANGTLIDIGCGTGAMLRAASAALPGWDLIGIEPHPRDAAALEAISGVRAIAPSLADCDAKVDLITIIHALEHVGDPVSVLRAARDALAPGGLVLVEVPHFPDNPFDLPIADHCTHFTETSLRAVADAAGLVPVAVSTGWVAKELTLLAHVGEAASTPAPARDTADALVAQSCTWLATVLDAARSAAADTPFGLFGTAIAANWLLGALDDRVSFFVDEDPNRIGRRYRGRPVHAPSDIPDGATVFMPLPRALAERIAGRLRGGSARYVLPPETGADPV